MIETAQVTKVILDAIGIDGYCKTSGSTGMHIYIPLGAKYTYEQSKEFAQSNCNDWFNKQLPQIHQH